MSRPFGSERLITAALAEPGEWSGSVTDDDRSAALAELREPLDVFCAALEAEANLTDAGRAATERYLARLLRVRLQLVELEATEPTLAAQLIEAPVFVIGAPRTGTTVLHRILAADSAHRAPEGWELLLPAPPPEPDTFATDPRIAIAGEELVFAQSVAEELTTMHTYSARMPKECLSAMAFSGRTEEFISRYSVPSYVEWLQAADLAPAYAMHHLVLRTLQLRMPTRRWVLKSPVHLQGLPELLATYPDARFVITHREPDEVLASVSSLIATLRSAYSGQVDPIAIGRYHADLYARSLDRLVDFCADGTLPADRTTHLQHRSVTADPVAAARSVCEGLAMEPSAEVLAAAAHEADSTRSDALGAHRYDPADYGLARGDTRFDRYRSQFLETAP